MNAQIKQLAEQAGFTVARGQGLKDTVPEDVFIANVCVSDEMEKFAELIVRECAKVVDIWSDEVPCSEGYDKLTVGKLKEHFGVKE